MAAEKDVVLIYIDDAPALFARVEEIRPDVKKDWFVIRMTLLQVPLQALSWILKADYINGEPFTMNGQKMRLEKVRCPDEVTDADAGKKPSGAAPDPSGDSAQPAGRKQGKLVAFPGRTDQGKNEDR